MTVPARRGAGESWLIGGQAPRSVRQVEAEGARRRQIAVEQGKLLATRVDVVMAASGYAARKADELIRIVADMGLDSERSELAGGRFIRSACDKAQALIDQIYGPLDS